MTVSGSTARLGRRPPEALLAGLAFLALEGCDAGVERRAQDAVNRRPPPAIPRPLGPAEVIVEAYVEEMGRNKQAYDQALAATGYNDALAEAALSSSEAFSLAPRRIDAGKAVAFKHRQAALAETDKTIAALSALSERRPEKAAMVKALTDELAAVRRRRADHWTFVDRIMEETRGAWTTLERAEGDWGLEPDGLKFTSLKDKEAYDAHLAKIGALIAQQQDVIVAQEASAANLRRLSRLFGA